MKKVLNERITEAKRNVEERKKGRRSERST